MILSGSRSSAGGDCCFEILCFGLTWRLIFCVISLWFGGDLRRLKAAGETVNDLRREVADHVGAVCFESRFESPFECSGFVLMSCVNLPPFFNISMLLRTAWSLENLLRSSILYSFVNSSLVESDLTIAAICCCFWFVLLQILSSDFLTNLRSFKAFSKFASDGCLQPRKPWNSEMMLSKLARIESSIKVENWQGFWSWN